MAGVMIRETLTQSATYASENRSNGVGGHYYCYFVDRSTTGGATSSKWQQGPDATTLPIWVKVTRSGSTFTGYTSSDGVYWTQNGASQTITMATSVYIGFFAASGAEKPAGQ